MKVSWKKLFHVKVFLLSKKKQTLRWRCLGVITKKIRKAFCNVDPLFFVNRAEKWMVTLYIIYMS